jgi:hypothetical protein
VSAFADREIVRLATEEFVPVTIDDWYQRRRQDDEGRFFIKVANQGPRKGEGGATRQGIYCLTADGELLAFKNAGQSAEATRDQLRSALDTFRKLPANRRQPGAIDVAPPGPPDRNYTRTPPEGGLIVRVHGRILDKNDVGVTKATCDFTGGDKASRDFLWLTANEVRAMGGGTVPKSVVTRLARFHLIDNTRGEPDFWKPEEVRDAELTLTVTSSTPARVEMSLAGRVLMADAADALTSQRGYECDLTGRLTYDVAARTFTRFDVAALGHHWGASTFTRKGVRPGRSLYGVAFGLPAGTRPGDRVPPQGARDLAGYLGRE